MKPPAIRCRTSRRPEASRRRRALRGHQRACVRCPGSSPRSSPRTAVGSARSLSASRVPTCYEVTRTTADSTRTRFIEITVTVTRPTEARGQPPPYRVSSLTAAGAGVTCARRFASILDGLVRRQRDLREHFPSSARTSPCVLGSAEAARVRLPPPEHADRRNRKDRTIAMVRSFKSGGGGSRTRVRKWILQSLYVRSVTQYFARGGERATDPQASYLNISSLTGATLAKDQPDSSTSRRPASGRQIRKRTTNRSYAANASSLLAIKVFQGVLRGPRNLGTLLHIHQTRRSRDAPDVLPAYGRPYL